MTLARNIWGFAASRLRTPGCFPGFDRCPAGCEELQGDFPMGKPWENHRKTVGKS